MALAPNACTLSGWATSVIDTTGARCRRIMMWGMTGTLASLDLGSRSMLGTRRFALADYGRAFEPRFDWPAIQAFYDEGHTYRECKARFGFKPATWTKAVRTGRMRPRPRRRPIEWILAQAKSRVTVKSRLLDAGILKNACDDCGISEWRGRFLSIQLDHRNGVRDDHRLENLRMLCPNCHSQTETFGARNRKPSADRKTEYSPLA
jgi:hypothetical protein